MHHSRCVRNETVVLDPFRLADLGAKDAIQSVIATTKKNVTIFCFEGFVGDDRS
jgi:hypothetical protein